jgi:DHA1 family bicyclomycin/chloramphenicol resistance-like MFS transporter
MEPLGEVAGAASSFIGFYATMVGAVIGYGFGHAFNGTIIPLAICYLTMGLASLAILLWDRRVSLNRRSEAS